METTSTTDGEPLEYLSQDCGLTLRAAIAQHRAHTPGLLLPDEPEIARLFDGHDAVHALFGCDTTMPGEASADTWTLCGTTLPARAYLDYLKHPAVRALVSQLGLGAMIIGSLRALPRVYRIWRVSRQMRQPWRFEDWAAHLDEPLFALRAEYGIQVVN